MKLCVFQGTFNPIHKAHLRIADFVLDKYGYDKIIFIPAYYPPHKEVEQKLSQHRYNMVELVVQDNCRYAISDIEYKRKGKSYTILTIKELYEKFQIDGKISFIIGTDAFDRIETWYNVDELKNLVKFLVFTRENDFNPQKYVNLKEKGYNFEIQTLKFQDISSTELREKIKQKQDIGQYVPKQVKEYILENGLYKN